LVSQTQAIYDNEQLYTKQNFSSTLLWWSVFYLYVPSLQKMDQTMIHHIYVYPWGQY
jgi:hypothetical protein